MLFNVEYDHGSVVEGYLIPDGFSEEATIFVTMDDGRDVAIACDQPKPAVVQSGRHATGMVGFRIDATRISDLANQRRLSIRDSKTGLLIYRRSPIDNPVQHKVLRLELSILPMMKFDAFCEESFQYAISGVERFGHETTMQAFHLNAASSVYISGRILLRNYEDFLDRGFQAIADIPDPYYEMACRLFTLNRLTRSMPNFLGDRDRLILSPAAEYFSEINLADDRALKRALQKAPDKVRRVLISPITQQFVCTYPEQRITRKDIAPAIGALARFTVVGHGDNSVHFQQGVGELLSVPPIDVPVVSKHSILKDLALRLRQIPVAETMLEEDLIFDHYVRQAVAPDVKVQG
ncbi:hypothetical protein [Agrobacterium tumefaciens]|uniref:hypothetical protein n=1 Tax=Agrobacterium tumefaciens TaxID=358 RepID=UPI0015730D07|nr:hypothetical protein [Agrobacterium tumefaciens]NSY51290.1 hypothetical protein [Agrobacterium tumefaciens]NTD89019.1 hypothetical protein [Agrobacterium tumefaciens]NTD93475.1 hypothetical protein [Agrobacterium tumefaciens]NTD97440.1 hypothetical protein [Agrobacterium tumefaciens]NTE16705.1 hypothetical protein [Agrobacterium tumefaciens]